MEAPGSLLGSRLPAPGVWRLPCQESACRGLFLASAIPVVFLSPFGPGAWFCQEMLGCLPTLGGDGDEGVPQSVLCLPPGGSVSPRNRGQESLAGRSDSPQAEGPGMGGWLGVPDRGLAGGVPWGAGTLPRPVPEARACGPRRPHVSCLPQGLCGTEDAAPPPRPAQGAVPAWSSFSVCPLQKAGAHGRGGHGVWLLSLRGQGCPRIWPPDHRPPAHLPVSSSGSLAPKPPPAPLSRPSRPSARALPRQAHTRDSQTLSKLLCLVSPARPTSSALCRWFVGCLLQEAPRDACSHPGESPQ